MIPKTYKERYKQLLHKKHLTKKDVRLFKEAVTHFVKRYPDWEQSELAA